MNNTNQKKEPKILFWDLECTHLKADWGTILCAGYKFLHEKKVHVPSIMDYEGWEKDVTNDKKLVQDFYKVLMEADLIVTYFGKGFDWKYITAKLLEHGLPPLPNIPHIDLFYTVKNNMALSRKSLDNVARFLDLENQKSPVTGKMWKQAQIGNKNAIKYVIKHCKFDVLVLEELYLKLRPLVRQHPRVGEVRNCSACGSNRLHRRGRALSTVAKTERYRYQCQDCRHWSVRP